MHGVETNKWIKKHKFVELRKERDVEHRDEEELSRKNVEFAKDLFISWDDDGSGVLEAMEIIKPLISLGLAPNSDFAIKLLKALDPNAAKSKSVDDIKITFPDFVKIFRTNKVSDALIGLIQKETEKRYKCNQ
jgi:Ca2+-binding EF-hand superfamily protein